MRDVTAELRDWAESLATSIAPVERDVVMSGRLRSDGAASRRRWTAAVAAVVVVGGVIVLGVVGASGDDPTDPTLLDIEDGGPQTTRDATTTSRAPTSPPTNAPPSVDIVPPGTIGTDRRPAAGPLTVGTPTVVTYDGLPLSEIAVSPSGRRIARQTRGGEMCVIDTTSSSEAVCIEVDGSVERWSLTWSPDESSLLFHDDAFAFFDEPDIQRWDVGSGQLEVLTDDGVSGSAGEVPEADFDVTPFHDADGVVHFFRLGDDPTSPTLLRLDPVTGEPVSVDGVDLGGVPARPFVDAADGRIVFATTAPGASARLTTLDLVEKEVTDVAVGLGGRVVDVAGGRALFLGGGSAGFTLVDLDGDLPIRSLPLPPAGSTQEVSGAGLSPDGTQVVVLLADTVDPAGHQLVVAPILDDSTVGDFLVLADSTALAPVADDITIRPRGLGDHREIVWTPDRLVFALGADMIVTLEFAR